MTLASIKRLWSSILVHSKVPPNTSIKRSFIGLLLQFTRFEGRRFSLAVFAVLLGPLSTGLFYALEMLLLLVQRLQRLCHCDSFQSRGLRHLYRQIQRACAPIASFDKVGDGSVLVGLLSTGTCCLSGSAFFLLGRRTFYNFIYYQCFSALVASGLSSISCLLGETSIGLVSCGLAWAGGRGTGG